MFFFKKRNTKTIRSPRHLQWEQIAAIRYSRQEENRVLFAEISTWPIRSPVAMQWENPSLCNELLFLWGFWSWITHLLTHRSASSVFGAGPFFPRTPKIWAYYYSALHSQHISCYLLALLGIGLEHSLVPVAVC